MVFAEEKSQENKHRKESQGKDDEAANNFPSQSDIPGKRPKQN